MKILKNILLVVVVFFALILLVAAFVPTEFAVERNVEIEKPKTEVFEYTKYLKNQEEFSVWARIDPLMERKFTGEDGKVGFVSAWKSDHPEVGVGEQEITGIDGENRIDYQLRFMVPFESNSDAYMTFSSIDSASTKVAWGFSGEMPYPTNLMLLFVDMEGELGGDLQTGLNNLKGILEN